MVCCASLHVQRHQSLALVRPLHLYNVLQPFKNHAASDLVASQSTRPQPLHTDLALRPPVCENGRERSTPIRLLCLLIRRSG